MDGSISEDADSLHGDTQETPLIELAQSTVPDTQSSEVENGVAIPSTWWLCCIFSYVVTCVIWPEIPVAFLALVTSAGLLGVFDKTSGTNVSSQTSRTNQACECIDLGGTDYRNIGVQIPNHTHMGGDEGIYNEFDMRRERHDNAGGPPLQNQNVAGCVEGTQTQNTFNEKTNLSTDVLETETLEVRQSGIDYVETIQELRCKTKRSPVRREMREGCSHECEDFCTSPGPKMSNNRRGELFFITTREETRKQEKPVLSSSLRPKKSKSPTKSSPSTRKSRLRESCSEIVTNKSHRKEIPVFAKVWRVSEPEVKQTVFDTQNVGDNVSVDSEISVRLSPKRGSPCGSSAHSSDDVRVIANFNGYDRNVNCHDCESTEDTNRPDYLAGPITAWLEDMQINCDNPTSDVLVDSSLKTSTVGNNSGSPMSSDKLPTNVLTAKAIICDCQDLEKVQKPDISNGEFRICQEKVLSCRDSQTQTVLFSDILRINVKKFLQAETRHFHKRRSKLRFKFARELGKLKQELTGKNRILSSLQLKIPALGEEIRHLQVEKEELECELEEEKNKTDNLMDRLTDVYQKLMLINSTKQMHVQEQLQQQQMHEQLQQYQLEKQLRQQFPEQFQEQFQRLHVQDHLQLQNVPQEHFQPTQQISEQLQQYQLQDLEHQLSEHLQ